MLLDFDPRHWNILAGLMVAVTGCGSRTIGQDSAEGADAESGTESATNSTTNSTTNSNEEDSPECIYDSDCPPYSTCTPEGYCHYDGYGEDVSLDCNFTNECAPFEYCSNNYCYPMDRPPPCMGEFGAAIPIDVDKTLGLQFIDADDDGQEELVVVTEDDLVLLESGSDVPITSPRGVSTPSIDDVSSGEFDGNQGADLVVLVDDEISIYPALGMGMFGAPTTIPSALTGTQGLIAGDFNGMNLDDLLLWNNEGASVDRDNGDVVELVSDLIVDAAAYEEGTPEASFVLVYREDLQTSPVLHLMHHDGSPLGGGLYPVDYEAAPTLATADLGQGQGYVFASPFDGWSHIEILDPQESWGGEWGIDPQVAKVAAGDFDGDGSDSVVVLTTGGEVWEIPTSLGSPTCQGMLDLAGNTAVEIATGDHDGDGDDELAVRFSPNVLVWVFDGEG